MAANFREKTSGSGIYYLPSADIQVFPSTYRNKVNGTIYDPEAKLNTELNYTRIPGYNKKESYIISWSGSNLEIVLHGYYFKIANLSLADCLYPFVGIKVEEVNLLDPASGSSAKTKILKPFESTNGAQDNALDLDIGGTAYFIGLAFAENAAPGGATYFIQLTDGNGYEYKGNRLPAIEANRNPAIADIFEGSFNTQLKDGAGATANYAVTLGGNAEASGIRSVAIGDHTVAKNENQVVLGAYNADAANSLFIIGNGTADNARSNAFEVYKDGTVKAPTKFVSPALDVTTITGTGTGSTLNINGATTFDSTVYITDTTACTGVGTGALQVYGGVDIGDSLNVYKNLTTGGAVHIANGPSGGSLDVAVTATFDGDLGLYVLDSYDNTVFEANTSAGVTIGDYNTAYPLTVFGHTDMYAPLKIYDDTEINQDINGTVTEASFMTAGGAYIAKKLVVDGDVYLRANHYPHSSGNGTLSVTGGISTSGNIVINSDTDAPGWDSINYGAFKVYGGATINKKLYVGDQLNLGTDLKFKIDSYNYGYSDGGMLKNFGGTLTNLGGFFEPPVDWTNDNSILVWLQKLPTFILYPVIDREEVLSPTENLLDHFTAHI